MTKREGNDHEGKRGWCQLLSLSTLDRKLLAFGLAQNLVCEAIPLDPYLIEEEDEERALELLKALDEWLQPTETLVVRGLQEELEQWRKRLPPRLLPRRLVLWIPSEAAGLSGLLAERKPRKGVTAYLCSGTHCQAPVSDPRELEQLLFISTDSENSCLTYE